MPCYVTSCHVTPYQSCVMSDHVYCGDDRLKVLSCHVMLHHVMSRHINLVSCQIMFIAVTIDLRFCHAMLCYIMSCHAISILCHVRSCLLR